MEPLTDGILIALFLWATVAVIKKRSWRKPESSCHVYICQGDDKPVADCASASPAKKAQLNLAMSHWASLRSPYWRLARSTGS